MIDNGGPAFPHDFERGMKEMEFAGMSLRDYFAAAALSGVVEVGCHESARPDEIAKAAYACADAMIKARKEGPYDTTNRITPPRS